MSSPSLLNHTFPIIINKNTKPFGVLPIHIFFKNQDIQQLLRRWKDQIH
jgi:hypothetical protein